MESASASAQVTEGIQPVTEQGADELRYLAYSSRLQSLFVASKKVLRYTAYTSDVGEAVRPIVPRNAVRAAYAVSWGYVGYDVYQAMNRDLEHTGGNTTSAALAGARQFVFQALASMALPALTISSIVRASVPVFTKLARFHRYGPTICGLSVVPLLPYMYDAPVEYVVDKAHDAAREQLGLPVGTATHHHKDN